MNDHDAPRLQHPVARWMLCAVVATLLVAATGCEHGDPLTEPQGPNNPITEEEPQILYRAAGGIVGGVYTDLRISKDGLARYGTTLPPLHQQLSEDEHQAILALFDDFFDLDDTYADTPCSDDIMHTITFNGDEASKTVSAWGCLIESEAVLKNFGSLTKTLGALYRRIYDEEAPWLGLDAQFSLDDDTYGLGEPISLRYRITNPTNKRRALFFPGVEQVGFGVYKPGISAFDYSYPIPERRNQTLAYPDSLVFAPGDVHTITYSWDQTTTDRAGGNPSTLDVGRYIIRLHLLDIGRLYADSTAFFDIIDRSVPLAGYVERDPEGEFNHEAPYTFKLVVRNWTDSPLTLRFPYRQHLRVKLYDAALRPPYPLIYENPDALIEEAATITLQPDEARTFSHTAAKSTLNLNEARYYVTIDLLTETVVFSRDRELRIPNEY